MAIKLETRGVGGTVTVAACEFCSAFCAESGGLIAHTRTCESGVKRERYYPEAEAT